MHFAQILIQNTCGYTGPAVIFGDNKAQVIFTGYDSSIDSGGGLSIRIGSSYTEIDLNNGLPSDNNYHYVNISFLPDKVLVYRDWTNNVVSQSGVIQGIGAIGLAGDTDDVRISDYIEYLSVRKYASLQPTAEVISD